MQKNEELGVKVGLHCTTTIGKAGSGRVHKYLLKSPYACFVLSV